jgi:glucosyl-dolichyl phosphate glucuronosyltransferase
MTGDSKPIVSCVICTYRRPDMLGRAIKCLSAQTLSRDKFEVIVVDNNSGDQTPAVVQYFQQNVDFSIIYLLETKQGLSFARNTGIQHSSGKYVAFLDDDAEADPEWLSTFVNVFEKYPNAWVVGGKILPIWDARRPSWLFDDLLNNFSMLDLGEIELTIKWPDHVLGTSCFHKKLFEEVGWFEPRLGRSGDSLVGDEDTEIQRRVLTVGKQIIYTPQAIAWHHISPERLTKHYIYFRAYGTGKSRAFMICQKGSYGLIFWQYCRSLLGFLYYLLAIFWMMWDEKKRIKTIRSIYTKLGFLNFTGSYLLRKQTREH